MRHTKLLLVAMVAITGPNLTSAQDLRPVANPDQLGFSAARLQRLTENYQGYVDRGELPGAVLLIARGEKIGYLQAVGYQDREKKTPMKVDAIFRLASMTKPIVSVAAMMLVEEGKLDLLAPVSQYLPEFDDLKVGIEQADIVGGKRALTLEPRPGCGQWASGRATAWPRTCPTFLIPSPRCSPALRLGPCGPRPPRSSGPGA